MQAMKCDFCGKLCECHEGLDIDGNSKIAAIALVTTNVDGLLKAAKTYDLCPECLKAITNVLETRKEIYGNETR